MNLPHSNTPIKEHVKKEEMEDEFNPSVSYEGLAEVADN